MNKLLIIESPNKIKTIKKYLNDEEFNIIATIGHIRDLSTSGLGFNEETLEPKWVIPRTKKNEKGLTSKKEIVNSIRDLAKKSDRIYLATDPDREGEAISWHVFSILDKNEQEKCRRITFNEITSEAIHEALDNPRKLDNLWVQSQFARRILDRLVGFKVSKIVHKKTNGKSAGRVQSVALKMIYDREQEIKNFVPKKWWTVDALTTDDDKLILRKVNEKIEDINYERINSEKEGSGVNFLDEASANKVIQSLGNEYKVYKIDDPKSLTQRPKEPYKTSTLQQEGISKLGWNVAKVTSVAQKLYEGVEIDGESVALISYPRTDSVKVSDVFIKKIKTFVVDNYGENYYEEHKFTNKGSNLKNVQGAHEAIRIIDLNIKPENIKGKVSNDEYKLYKLIWVRTIAAFMRSAQYETVVIRIINNDNKFYSYSRTLKFDGFKKIYVVDEDEIHTHQAKIKNISVGSLIEVKKVEVKEHTTTPPLRFNQASLIKELDAAGVGRPSTYRSMADMAIQRGYAVMKDRAYHMTDLGNRAVEFLIKYFSFIVDVAFTSKVEEQLDQIANGEIEWKEPIHEFQPILNKELKAAGKKEDAINEKVGRKCPKCGSDLIYRFSKKNGKKFIGCGAFPKCKYVEFENDETIKPTLLDISCPECGKPLCVKLNRRKQKFIGCSNYPECKYIMKADAKKITEIEATHTVKD